MANISISEIQTSAQSLNSGDLLLISKENNGTYQSAKITKTSLLNSLPGLPDPDINRIIDVGVQLVGENASYTVQIPSWVHLDCNSYEGVTTFGIILYVNNHPIGECHRSENDNNFSHIWFPLRPGDILTCQNLTSELITSNIVMIHLHPCR